MKLEISRIMPFLMASVFLISFAPEAQIFARTLVVHEALNLHKPVSHHVSGLIERGEPLQYGYPQNLSVGTASATPKWSQNSTWAIANVGNHVNSAMSTLNNGGSANSIWCVAQDLQNLLGNDLSDEFQKIGCSAGNYYCLCDLKTRQQFAENTLNQFRSMNEGGNSGWTHCNNDLNMVMMQASYFLSAFCYRLRGHVWLPDVTIFDTD